MAYTTVPTQIAGNSWSAAQQNTYIRDNFAALFPYSAIGDIAVASAANALTAIAKPSVPSVFTMNSTGVASWKAYNTITGALHAKATADFYPNQTFASTWADVTGATVTMTTSVTCTILIIADVVGYNSLTNTGRGFYVRGVVAGVADAAAAGTILNGSSATLRNEALPYIYYATGVAAGSVIAKLQCQADANSNIVTQGRITAFAYVE